MHKSESSDHSTKRAVTQADADRCCGASERHDSTPSPGGSALSAISLTVVTTAIVPTLPEVPARAEPWHRTAPVSATRVPKHLLLSVLLV